MIFDAWIDAVERWMIWRRIRTAALILLAGNLAITIGWLATLRDLMDRFRQPLGGDFVIFYAASRLTLKGQAALAFSAKALLEAEQAAVSGTPAGLVWSYPPPFQMLIAPLALAPFVVSFAIWTALGAAGYLMALRRFSADSRTWLLACAFPGLYAAAWQGQTSLFVLAVLGIGLAELDRRPWRAGMILGLLICKPQFALLLPLLMLGTGRWRTVLGAALTIVILASLSVFVFGATLWEAFFGNLSEASSWVSSGALPWEKVPSLFVSLAWLGVPHGLAGACQTAVAVMAALITLAAWRQAGPLSLKAALAVCATLLVTPYVLNYDLVLLAIPIAAVGAYCAREAAPPGTKLILALAVATPVIFLGLAQRTHAQLAPIAIMIVFWGTWRVYRAEIRRVRVVPASMGVLKAATFGRAMKRAQGLRAD